MRSFIGLDLHADEKLKLEHWRNQAMPEVMPRGTIKKKAGDSASPAQPYSIPTANYHITLCFLGNIHPQQHEILCQYLDELNHSPFDVHLDITGFWSGPKIIFAAPSTPPQALLDLARDCRKAARNAGIEVENRQYNPHVTLIRKATPALPSPLFTPDVTMRVTQFHLFESVSAPSGVHYPIRKSWDLSYSDSIRERLKRGQI